MEQLVLDPDEMKRTNLANRPAMAEIAKLHQEGKDVDAMNRYVALFYDKLRHPDKYGIYAVDIDPASKGTANIGDYPPILLPSLTSRHDPWLDPAAIQKKADDGIIANADQLLTDMVTIGGKPTNIGEPGSVNWQLGRKSAWTDQHPELFTPDDSLTSGIAFNPLLMAYVLTHDEKYLTKWIDFMEDWSLNSHYAEQIRACFVPDGVTSATMQTQSLTRLFSALAAKTEPGKEGIPPRVLAEVLMKRFDVFLLQHVVYLRSNTHNWTPGAGALSVALFYDEFTWSPILFRETRRRSIEDNAVTQNLRDGTENQEDPWYNGNYLTVAAAFPLLAARSTLPDDQEVPWVRDVRDDKEWHEEIQDHLDEHVTYRIHLRTGQGQWPIPFRGGDNRIGSISELGGTVADYFPKVAADPTNEAILAATQPPLHVKPGPGPSYTADWFPYPGFNTVRDGWKATDDSAALFCSPQPAAYGAFRGLKNNNTFCLHAYQQDLIIDDCNGHYMNVSSPLLVDKAEEFFNVGVYHPGGLSGHKAYQVSAWTEPSQFRWHASDRFNLMEGVYSGAYVNQHTPTPGPDAVAKLPDRDYSNMVPRGYGITDVSHQRLCLYVRNEKLWIVTDRITSPGQHDYELAWFLPSTPGSQPGFAPEQVQLDQQNHTIITHADTTQIKRRSPDKDGKTEDTIPKANVSMYQFTTAPLTYASKIIERPPINGVYYMTSWNRIGVDWNGTGNQQVVNAILPRPPGNDPAHDFKSIKQITGGNNSVGFEAILPDGAKVEYLSSPDAKDQITLGNVTIQGGSLLLSGGAGIALDCTAMQVNGKDVTPPGKDFEFDLAGGKVAFQPIYRPIEPVVVGPDRNVFTDSIDMTLTSKTPGVDIRYTLDGSDPTPDSPLYAGPVKIDHSVVVKTRAYRAGVKENPVTTTGTEATPICLGVFTKQEPQPAVDGGKAAGLQASYYQDDWKTLWFHEANLKPQAACVVPQLFDLKLIPADNPPVGDAAAPRSKYFAIDYRGFLNVPQDGVYTFHAPREYVMPDTESGYDLRVFVGDNLDAKTGTNLGPLEWYPSTRLHALGNWSVALKKGAHPFRVYYLDYRTDAAEKLNLPGINDYVWTGVTPDLKVSGPGIDLEPIPASWLTHG